jgi:hypothetical protein
MNSGGLGFWGTVWAGVVVAAIVGIASWLFSFHHAAWLWMASVASGIWTTLIFSVPVPVSVVVIFAAAFLYLWRRGRRRTVAATSAGNRSPSIVGPLVAADSFEEQDKPVRPATLTDNEIEIVRVLAKADGRRMTKEGLARAAGLPNLFAEQAIDRLSGRNLLHQVSTLDRVAYYLSPAGRDYAIAEGYVARPDGAAFPTF